MTSVPRVGSRLSNGIGRAHGSVRGVSARVRVRVAAVSHVSIASRDIAGGGRRFAGVFGFLFRTAIAGRAPRKRP